jgi:hypothetical protein
MLDVAVKPPTRAPLATPDITAAGKTQSKREPNTRLVNASLALAAGGTVSVILSYKSLAKTYDGFFGVAATSWPATWLIITNLVLTMLFILVTSILVKPRSTKAGQIAFAVMIALSFQTLVNSDLEVLKTLTGAEPVGPSAPQQFNVGSLLYNDVEHYLTRQIASEVDKEEEREVKALQSLYPGVEGVLSLRESMVSRLERSRMFTQDQRMDHIAQIDGVVASDSLTPAQKVQKLAVKMYDLFGRDVVERLLPDRSA